MVQRREGSSKIPKAFLLPLLSNRKENHGAEPRGKKKRKGRGKKDDQKERLSQKEKRDGGKGGGGIFISYSSANRIRAGGGKFRRPGEIHYQGRGRRGFGKKFERRSEKEKGRGTDYTPIGSFLLKNTPRKR